MLLGRPSRWPSRSAGPPRSVGAFGTDTYSVSPSFFLPPFRRDATTTDPPVRRSFGLVLVESQTDVNIDVSRNGSRELRQVRVSNMAECTSLSSLHWGWKIELSSAVRPIPYHSLRMWWYGKARDVNTMLLQPAK